MRLAALPPHRKAEALASKQGPHPRQTPPAKRGVPVGHSATAQLDADELAVILDELVSALVARDYRRLEHLVDEGCRHDLEDLYRWTKRWRCWDEVTLVMPPGAPETWTISSDGSYADTDGRQVLVAMWTAEEGFSDLTLEVRLTRGSRGEVRGAPRHVSASARQKLFRLRRERSSPGARSGRTDPLRHPRCPRTCGHGSRTGGTPVVRWVRSALGTAGAPTVGLWMRSQPWLILRRR